MGVDVRKQILTGAMFSQNDLGRDFIDQYFMKDNEQTFGGKVQLIQLNPYGGRSKFNDYIIGVIDKEEEGDGDRAQKQDEETLEELILNTDSASLVTEQLKKYNLLNDKHPVKTYKVTYFC